MSIFFVIVIDKDKRFCRRAYYMVVTESFGLAFASVLAYMLPWLAPLFYPVWRCPHHFTRCFVLGMTLIFMSFLKS